MKPGRLSCSFFADFPGHTINPQSRLQTVPQEKAVFPIGKRRSPTEEGGKFHAGCFQLTGSCGNGIGGITSIIVPAHPPFLANPVGLPSCGLLDVEQDQIGLLVFVKGIDHHLGVALPVHNIFVGKKADLATGFFQCQISGQSDSSLPPVQA